MTMYIKPYRSRRYQLKRNPQSVERDVHVPLDIKSEDDAYVIEMIVPGLEPEDLEIEIIKNRIDIQGEFVREEEDENYLRKEIPTGSFHRVIRLSKMLKADESEANLEKGVLSLRVPLAEESLPRTIQVNKN